MAVKHHATTEQATKPVKPVATIGLMIEGMRESSTEPGLFLIDVEELPQSVSCTSLMEELQDQKVDPRVIDEALEAVYTVIHKDMVVRLLAKRVRYAGPVDHIR